MRDLPWFVFAEQHPQEVATFDKEAARCITKEANKEALVLDEFQRFMAEVLADPIPVRAVTRFWRFNRLLQAAPASVVKLVEKQPEARKFGEKHGTYIAFEYLQWAHTPASSIRKEIRRD